MNISCAGFSLHLCLSVLLSQACRAVCIFTVYVCADKSLSFAFTLLFAVCVCTCVCVRTFISVLLACSDGSQQFPVYLASWFPVRACNKWSLAGLMSTQLAEWVFGSAKHSIMAWCCYHIPHKYLQTCTHTYTTGYFSNHPLFLLLITHTHQSPIKHPSPCPPPKSG